MKEISFNILIDESGDTTNLKDNPMNRAVGALIFFEDYSKLENDFLKFVEKNSELNIFIKDKPHNLKYETLKKQPNSEELFELILNFLIQKGCKFYWHPIKDQNKKHQKNENGIRFTKLVESCNLDILPNLVIRLKAEDNKIDKINLYCDIGTYNPKNKRDTLCFYIDNNSFNYYEQIGEQYNVHLKYVKSKDLHWCTDIITGISRENFNKWLPHAKSYNLLLNNKFADIVDNEFT